MTQPGCRQDRLSQRQIVFQQDFDEPFQFLHKPQTDFILRGAINAVTMKFEESMIEASLLEGGAR